METKTTIFFDDTSVAFASRSDSELNNMNKLFTLMGWSKITKIGTFLIKTAFKLHLPIKKVIKNTVFRVFCGGETLEECKKPVQNLYRYKIHSIPDYSVEGQNSERNFDHTVQEVLKVIQWAAEEKAVRFAVFKFTGIASFELLEKIQANENLSPEEQNAYERVKERANQLCKTAYDLDVKILIDAEETWIQAPIDALAEAMMKKYNQKKAIVYNTFQMYRIAGPELLGKAYKNAINEKYYLGVKLVRGAYMEKEAARAIEKGYQNPIFPTKEATDNAYDRALDFCIRNIERIRLCAGTHNEISNRKLIRIMDQYHIMPSDERIDFAQLYGMSDHISFTLSANGYNVSKYLPFGPVESVMPYLFRRAEENKSVMGRSSRELMMIRKEIKRRTKKQNTVRNGYFETTVFCILFQYF